MTRQGDPPTGDELERLSSRVSRRVWVTHEGDAIGLLLCGPEGERLVQFRVKPSLGRSWSSAPIADAIEAFAGSLAQLSDLLGSTPGATPQDILRGLEEHAAIVRQHHEGVAIERGEIFSLEPGDWLG